METVFYMEGTVEIMALYVKGLETYLSFRESRKEIKELVNKKYSYLDYAKHEDLKSFCICPFAEDEETQTDWYEMVVIVPKQWLLETVREMYNIQTEEDMQYWLEDEYTTDESEPIFEKALNERKVVMVDFD